MTFVLHFCFACCHFRISWRHFAFLPGDGPAEAFAGRPFGTWSDDVGCLRMPSDVYKSFMFGQLGQLQEQLRLNALKAPLKLLSCLV